MLKVASAQFLCNVQLFRTGEFEELWLPLAQQGISCGFPSPAEDYIEESMDLNRQLVRDRAATFVGRVRGDSMRDAQIFDGDTLVIDRSLTAKSGDVCLCQLAGEFTVKKVEFEGHRVILHPANPEFNPVIVTPDMEFSVWGVVTYVIHKTKV
jgi:DNA polymerase V